MGFCLPDGNLLNLICGSAGGGAVCGNGIGPLRSGAAP